MLPQAVKALKRSRLEAVADVIDFFPVHGVGDILARPAIRLKEQQLALGVGVEELACLQADLHLQLRGAQCGFLLILGEIEGGGRARLNQPRHSRRSGCWIA